MRISVPPVGIGLIIVVVSNFFVSFGKSNAMKKTYIVVSSVLSVMGIVGIIIIRPSLILSLNNNLNRGRLDDDFVSWAITKFDSFAVISIIATLLIIILLLYLLRVNKKNKDGIDWYALSIIVNIFRMINFSVTIVYSIGTVNKHFDLAAYISILSISQIFVLYIPLIAKKIMILKNESKSMI